MRLTCPNCDARYEVPDEVVPLSGRDVQCSNCGQTWFQYHPDHMPAEENAEIADEAESQLEDVAPAPPAPDAAPPPDDPTPAPVAEATPAPVASPTAAPKRKTVDPAVADILRQEAKAEQTARQKELANTLESQPDLGLDDASAGERPISKEQQTKEARKRMARLQGVSDTTEEPEVSTATVSPRRDLLPDIDEINSTLRTKGDRGGANQQVVVDAPTTQTRRRGFRTGFLVVLALFAILAILYVYAPKIAQAVPQVDPYLSSYVTWVDQMRLWLDGHVQNLLRGLDNLATQSSS